MDSPAREQRFSDALYSTQPEIERSSKRYMRDMVPRSKSMRVLDVGCGTGLNARILRDMGHTVVGTDLSPVAIERLKEAGFEGYVCDVPAGLPFESGSFDLVYASEVIEHIGDTEGFLAELARVLKPGGMLMLSTPNSAFWPFRILGLLGRTPTEVQHPGHLRFFSKRSLTDAIADAGFADISTSARHIYFLLPGSVASPLAVALRRIGFTPEYRLRTHSYVWLVDRLAQRASPFWADTFIVTAIRARARSRPYRQRTTYTADIA